MAHRHLESTASKESECGGCGAAILVALVDGLSAKADAVPLADQAAELDALIHGRTTYYRTAGKFLITRDADQITARPHASPIHASHECAQTTLF
jgi:hypothetical protein